MKAEQIIELIADTIDECKEADYDREDEYVGKTVNEYQAAELIYKKLLEAGVIIAPKA